MHRDSGNKVKTEQYKIRTNMDSGRRRTVMTLIKLSVRSSLKVSRIEEHLMKHKYRNIVIIRTSFFDVPFSRTKYPYDKADRKRYRSQITEVFLFFFSILQK